jgi:SAM-dependent methyltransferase
MQNAQFQLHAQIEERHWWFVARRRILADLIASVLPLSSGGLVLDVGCGAGANLAALARDYRCVGIDASAVAIELAEQRFPGIEFLCGYAPDDVPSETLAATRLIMLNDVLEHVRDDYLLLSTLLAAAQPGTMFLLTVPAGPELWSPHDEAFGHFRRYQKADFCALWNELPVTPRLVGYFNARLYPLIWSIRRWNRFRGAAQGRAGTDFNLPAPWMNRALTNLFAGERRRLARMIRQPSVRGYRRGVSLVALLERESGEILPRTKPAGAAADLFDPVLAELSRGVLRGLANEGVPAKRGGC